MTKTWGPCTWFLFHTLAEKIKDDHFESNKVLLINMIKRLCDNLPCPECAGHARSQMNSLNITNIKSKEDLKNMLYSFHNLVNQRTNKPNFPKEELDKKYNKAITINIVKYFLQVWNKRSHNPKLMTEDLHKSRAVNDFITWWNVNNNIFNP